MPAATQEDAPGAPPSIAALARVSSFHARMASPEHRAWLKRAASSRGEVVEAGEPSGRRAFGAPQHDQPAPAPPRWRTPWLVQQQHAQFLPPKPDLDALERVQEGRVT